MFGFGFFFQLANWLMKVRKRLLGDQLSIKGLIRVSERDQSLLPRLEAGLGSGVFLALRGHAKSLLLGNPRLLGLKAFG